jgi:hypothetical protein
MNRFALLLLSPWLVSAAFAQAPAANADWYSTYAAWVQVVAGGAEVRAVANANGRCPTARFGPPGGQIISSVPMQRRAEASAEFPIVCTLILPPGEKTVSVDMHGLGEPKGDIAKMFRASVADPQRILVLGDTGCRIKGTFVQACNDPSAWPFAGLAQAAAALKPDLVIHLGDYLYRESPCPTGNTGCAGSPFGDNWDSWAADFFVPAAPLLAAAPWIFVRGNHEDCSRAGAGYLRLLGPTAYDPAALCAEHQPPYAVNVESHVIAVMDNASASDTSVDDKAVALYRADFEALKALGNVSPELWLVSHRPVWAAISGPLGIPIGGNATMIAASGDLSAFQAISLMLSGHIHTFEAINYTVKLPPQIVAGHGGDYLDPTPANLRGAIFQGHSGVSVKDGLSVNGFGFLLMTRDAATKDWIIQLYDSAGTPERQCRFVARRVDCPSTN